jgi:aminobenzoyl-glutamate utilization protein B
MNYFFKKYRKVLTALVMVLIFSLVLPVPVQAAPKDKGFTKEQQIALDYLSDPAVGKKYAEMINAIWSYAELGLEEYNSAALLTYVLEEEGFTVERGVAGMPTAFVATYSNGKGPTIGVLGEYDALAELSQESGSGVQNPIVPGAPGHGCTHNTMGVAAVATVVAVKEAMDKGKFTGTIKMFGSPSEETLISRPYMVKAGLFDGVDVVIDNHGGSSFGSSYGKSGNALFSFEVKFTGITAHSGGSPWLGRSALDAVVLMEIAQNFLREHIFYSARIHSSITNGGGQPNVVPGEASIWYFIREDDSRILDLFERTINNAKAAALATGTTYEIIPYSAIHQRYGNKAVAELLQKNINKVGYPDWSQEAIEVAKKFQAEAGLPVIGLRTQAAAEPSGPPAVFTGGGSSDVAEVTMIVPTASLSFPSSIPGDTSHHWTRTAGTATAVAHEGTMAGAKVMAVSAIEIMTNHKLLKEIKDDFEASKKTYPILEKYESYLDVLFKEAGKPIAPPLGFMHEEMSKYRYLMSEFYQTPDWYDGPIVTE